MTAFMQADFRDGVSNELQSIGIGSRSQIRHASCSMPRRALLPTSLWLQGILIAVLAVAIVGLLFQRHSWADWARPNWLEGDPLEVYARVKIAGEQPGRAILDFTRVDRLGAPTGADWSAYPVPDRLVLALTGWLARVTGLMAAINMVSALILGLNAASFFLCARWLRARWEWAAGLALVFALGSYGIRWGITLSLSQVFVLPPLVLLCARAARRAPAGNFGRSWKILAVGLGLWLGLANPYLAFFAGLVASGALLLGFARRVGAARRIPLLVFLGCLLASFLLSNAAYIGPRLAGATRAALLRSPGDFAVYALHPLEWLVPPADHRVPALARLGHAYLEARHGVGEFFYNYLGLLGVAGATVLLFRAGSDLAHRRWSRLDALLGLLWIVAFAMPGGLNRWLGAAGLDVFRAGTRIGIYAQVWALLFFSGWLSRNLRRVPRRISVVLALVLAGGAIWEQTPPLGDHLVAAINQARWQSYTQLTTALESALPPRAAIFQLPVVPFPEAGRTEKLADYEHLLPLLTSRSLRFSYGQVRGSPALAWSWYVSRQPATEMVAALEQAGFSALWVDPRGYADGGEKLLAAITATGRRGLEASALANGIHVFRLRPAAQPVPPDFNDPRLNEHWDNLTPDTRPLVLALHGWFPAEHEGANQWRWATRDASLGVWWDGAPAGAVVRFRLNGPARNSVALRQNGRTLQIIAVSPETKEISIELAAGLTTLEWSLQGATFHPGGADPRELGFMVENLSVSVP